MTPAIRELSRLQQSVGGPVSRLGQVAAPFIQATSGAASIASTLGRLANPYRRHISRLIAEVKEQKT